MNTSMVNLWRKALHYQKCLNDIWSEDRNEHHESQASNEKKMAYVSEDPRITSS